MLDVYPVFPVHVVEQFSVLWSVERILSVWSQQGHSVRVYLICKQIKPRWKVKFFSRADSWHVLVLAGVVVSTQKPRLEIPYSPTRVNNDLCRKTVVSDTTGVKIHLRFRLGSVNSGQGSIYGTKSICH